MLSHIVPSLSREATKAVVDCCQPKILERLGMLCGLELIAWRGCSSFDEAPGVDRVAGRRLAPAPNHDAEGGVCVACTVSRE